MTEYIKKNIVKLYPDNFCYNWYLLYDFNIIYKYYIDNSESRFRINFLNYLLETISDNDIDNINNNINIGDILIYKFSSIDFIKDLKYIEKNIPSKIKDNFLIRENNKIKWDFYILPLVKKYLNT